MIEFTDKEFEIILKQCNFDDELLQIAIMIHKKYSRVKMMLELIDMNYANSERTLDRKIYKVKNKMYEVLKRRFFYEGNN